LYNNATSSQYGYDAFGTRVYQITASTSAATTTYPFKFFSIASTTKGTNNFATSTEYVFNGDTLIATVDQAFKNGSATGTPATRYIHPDHLGSTNVVTNASGTVVQTIDYYPYGAIRVSTSTGAADSARKFIGQFVDTSGLDYLNARYYESARGQFISQDPVFWEIGLSQDGRNALSNPQALNSYGYASDNPITNKDPLGRITMLVSRPIADEGVISAIGGHTFLLVLPNSSSVGGIPGIDTSRPFTLAGYANPNTGMLFKSASQSNDSSDYGRWSAGCPGCAMTMIAPPQGVSSQQFDKNVVSSFNNLPQDVAPYQFLGYPGLTGKSNSNNLANTILSNAGVSRVSIATAQNTLYASNFKYNSGLSQGVGGSYLQRLSSVLSSLASALAQLTAISSKNSSSK
jgi:RHS repeat-associated protein